MSNAELIAQARECTKVIGQIMEFITKHPTGFDPGLAERRVKARLDQIDRLFDAALEARQAVIECDCETSVSPDGSRLTRCGSDQMRRAVGEGHAFTTAAPVQQVDGSAEREVFAAYLKDCDDHCIRADVAGAFAYAWRARRPAEPFAYACPANCGCLWRDNKDGSMSLFGASSSSCAVCEPMGPDQMTKLFTEPGGRS